MRLFLFRAATTSGGNCGLVTLFAAGSSLSDCAVGDGMAALSPVKITTIQAPIANVIHASTFPSEMWAWRNNRTMIWSAIHWWVIPHIGHLAGVCIG
jgi:hypothetical protein